jgi:peroxiredoxin
VKHLPGYIENLDKIRGKGVDVVAVVAFNDAWVMSAWGKANGIRGDGIVSLFALGYIVASPKRSEGTLILTSKKQQLFMSDSDTKFSKTLGWTNGERTARYAMIIDHGKIVYAEKEPGGDVTVRAEGISDFSCLYTANLLNLTRFLVRIPFSQSYNTEQRKPPRSNHRLQPNQFAAVFNSPCATGICIVLY